VRLASVVWGDALIDLHCHILPGIDDGAPDLSVSLEMARQAVADGIETVACTPHILPGVYNNAGPAIRAAVRELARALEEAAIPLSLVPGADAYMAPDMIAGLRSGRILTLNDSRYLLFEPPHHIAPPRLNEFAFQLITAGYVPILTHPERLSWIESHYRVMQRLAHDGVWMQLTAGSLTGRFGRRPRYWSERMLDEGLIELMATDAHDPNNRPPFLAEARDLVADRCGDTKADELVRGRPLDILENRAPSNLRDTGVQSASDSRGGATAVGKGK
jgi:protein-tyrosine phosphatase